MRTQPEVLVIGAGVIGLSTAVCLAEEGFRVHIRTRDRPAQTTSGAAGAIWGPYLAADDRSSSWSSHTRSVLTELARTSGTGVRMIHGLEAGRAEAAPPGWATTLDDFRQCRSLELPDGFVSGWWYTVPVVDMPVYLDYLCRRLGDAGGRIETGALATLDEAAAAAAVTVNCTGVDARHLVPDPAVTPVRGQLVVVENPGIDTFFVDLYNGPEQTCVLPHGDLVVLGGTVEPGRTERTPDSGTVDAIVGRCRTVEPSLARAHVVGHRVGLRPSRPRVRLERADLGRRHVVHNYGHGGSGVTFSWGCARDVLGLVGQL